MDPSVKDSVGSENTPDDASETQNRSIDPVDLIGPLENEEHQDGVHEDDRHFCCICPSDIKADQVDKCQQ